MSYLVDTNVLSELRRRRPDGRVVEWFTRRPATTLYLSVLTVGEQLVEYVLVHALGRCMLARALQ